MRKFWLVLAASLGLAVVVGFQGCHPAFTPSHSQQTSGSANDSDGAGSPVTPTLPPISPPQPPTPLVPPFTPVNSFDPVKIIPNRNLLVPAGVTYPDTVPDTLDLAERASRYILGAVQTADPDRWFAPAAASLNSKFTYDEPGPRMVVRDWGGPNWGEVMLALAQAREMASYDRNNTNNTVEMQFQMFRNLLNSDIQRDLGLTTINPTLNFAEGGSAVTQATYVMQALIKSWDQTGRSDVAAAVDLYVRIHKSMQSKVNDSTRDFFPFFFRPSVQPYALELGYMGPSYVPFIAGTAMIGLQEWYERSADQSAWTMALQQRDFILNYQSSKFWVSPDVSKYGFVPGKGFAGHMYSWLEAVRGILHQARELKKYSPESSRVLTDFAHDIYKFMKSRTNAGYVGNFGSSGTTGDMVLIGLLLTELGAGNYHDEVEAWVRNQMTENEIDPAGAAYIPNIATDNWSTDHIGRKVTGLFFADATYIRAIPPESQAFTSDDHAMPMRALHEVWSNIVKVHGDMAHINFHLNVAGRYLDVKSEVPYRGHLRLVTKSSLGAIKNAAVRVPAGVDPAKVKVLRQNSNGSTTPMPVLLNAGPYGAYVSFSGLAINSTYIVEYPIFTFQSPVYQSSYGSGHWKESSFPVDPQDEVVKIWQGTFRGGALVKIEGSESFASGIPRYAQPWRSYLASLDGTDATAPEIPVTRFVYRGDSDSVPK